MERRRGPGASAALVGATAGVGAVLALAGCGQSPATPSPTVSVSAAPAAAAALSGPKTGDLLVQGTLRGLEPGPDAATVRVELWPHDDDTEVGEAVDLWESEPVTVDAAGHWAVEVDPSALPSKFLSPDRPYVNFDLVVLAGATGTQWSTTAWLTDEGDVWRSEGATVGDRVIDLSMDFGTRQITLTDSLGEATTSPLTLGELGPPAD